MSARLGCFKVFRPPGQRPEVGQDAVDLGKVGVPRARGRGRQVGEVAHDGGKMVDRGGRAGLPSASALARAASTAATKLSRTPWASSTASAASVVPPGEVTLRRSSAGDS